MADIIRSWQCLNGRCSKQFDAWEANPACPTCQCVRVKWVPGGGHVAGTAGAADAELRKLADCFGFTDMNSAQRDRAAKKIAAQPPPASGPPIHFAPGFSATAPNQNQSVCVPSSSGVEFKATVGIGNKLAPSGTYPGIAKNTVIEAKYRAPV